MANSYVAAMVTHIEGLTLSVPLAGVKVPPLPASASSPYVIVRQVSGVEIQGLERRIDVNEAVMQVEVWSDDYEQAWNIREELKDEFIDDSQSIGGQATIGPPLHIVDAELHDGPRDLYQLIARFLIRWKE